MLCDTLWNSFHLTCYRFCHQVLILPECQGTLFLIIITFILKWKWRYIDYLASLHCVEVVFPRHNTLIILHLFTLITIIVINFLMCRKHVLKHWNFSFLVPRVCHH